jgi:integrase
MAAYLSFIATENAPRHVENKISMLRRFIGTDRADNIPRPVASDKPRRRFKKAYPVFFKGTFVDEITPTLLQEFMDGLKVGMKTKRHYREFFHHFFEHSIKFGHYRPDNIHCPNPMAALPSFLSKNRRIVFLSHDDVDKQLAVLTPHPAFHMAAALMIYAGLRRAETLWLTRDSFSQDLSFLSVVNRLDEESDTESSLKTGERTVTILPQLRSILEKYLPTLQTRWVVPLPSGGRWNGDAFGKRLAAHNSAAGVKWTCLHYRHTYATQRAAEGWSLLRISHEMGNSVKIVAEFYAGYMRPVEIGAPPQPPELHVVRAA